MHKFLGFWSLPSQICLAKFLGSKTERRSLGAPVAFVFYEHEAGV